MPEAKGKVSGLHSENRIAFYGLSTCIWCKRTRQYLESEGVEFDFAYVDLLPGQEREEVLSRIRQWNPATSFPTIVINDTRCVVGYRPEELKEALGL